MIYLYGHEAQLSMVKMMIVLAAPYNYVESNDSCASFVNSIYMSSF